MTPTTPYPGLRPFQRQEAEIFFGRGEQINQMLSKLETHRFLAVVGTSGCGKSSLVLAGLLPALQDGFLTGAEGPWRVIVFRPGEAPFTRLAQALHRSGGGQDALSPQAVALTAATLTASTRGLADALHDLGIPPDVHLLLVVDQFEEIFRFWRETDRNKADAFVALLLASVHQDLPIHVVLTMRSDYLGDCAIFSTLPEMLNDSQYLTPRLTREQRRAAIQSPAQVCGGSVEPPLVNQLLNDMGAEPDRLPVMQHVLMRLWMRASAAAATASTPGKSAAIVLRHQDYQDIGGLARALDRHAEEIYAHFTPAQRQIVEVLFRCLSERDTSATQAGKRDTRRPTRLDSIAKVAGASVEQVMAVADVYRGPGVNFLVPPLEVPLTPETFLDVSHESLLQRWQRLQGWVVEEAKSAEIYRRLGEAAKLWADNDTGFLLDRGQLGFYLDWRKREQPTAAWTERYGGDFDLAIRFLNESDRAEKDRVAALEKETKKQLKEKLQRRYLSWGFCLAVAMLGLTFYFAIVAYNAAGQAEQQAEIANQQRKIADVYKMDADKQATQATQDAQRSNVLRLAAEVQSSQSKTPLTSVLLAVEVMNLASQPGIPADMTTAAEDAYRKALANIGGQGYWAGQGPITKLAVSADDSIKQQWLAAAGSDGSLALWKIQAAQGQPKPIRLSFGFLLPINSLMICPNARWLVAGSGPSNLLTLWDLNSPNLDCKVTHAYGGLSMATYGKWLLSYGTGREGPASIAKAQLFDLHLDNPVASPIDLTFDAGASGITGMLAFSPNKQWLALVSSAGDVFLCDLQTARPGSDLQARKLTAAPRPTPQVGQIQRALNCDFTSSSDKLVVYSADGTVRFWQDHGGLWDQPAVDAKLNTSFDMKIPVDVVTDARGLLAVVSKKTPDNAATYFFDASQKDFPKSAARLMGFNGNTVDLTKHFLIDEHKQWLVAYGKRRTDGIWVWNLKDSSAVKLPISVKPPEGVDQVLLTSDGRWLVTSGLENYARLYDLWSPGFSSNSQILRGHDGFISQCAIGQGNHWLVTGGADGSVRTWDLAFPTPSAEPAIYRDPLPQSMLVTPTHRWLAFGDGGGIVRLWDLANGAFYVDPTYHLISFQKPVLQSSKDGRWLAVSANDATGKTTVTILWDLEGQSDGPTKLCELSQVHGRITDFAVSADGVWIAANVSQNASTGVQLWKTIAAPGPGPAQKIAQPQVLPQKENHFLGFVAAGKALLTLSDRTYTLWALGADGIKAIPSRLGYLKSSMLDAGLLTADGKYLIAPQATEYLVVDVQSIADGKPAEPKYLDSLSDLILASPNNRWLVGLDEQERIAFWDLGSDQASIPSNPIDAAVSAVDVPNVEPASPDHRWLIMPTTTGQLFLYDLNAPTGDAGGIDLKTNISSAVFSPDSLWLITSGEGGIQVRNLQTPTAEPKASLADKDFHGSIVKAAVSPDGRWLALVGQDLLTRVWDLTKGKDAAPTVLPNGMLPFQATDIFVSANGDLVIALNQDLNAARISRVQVRDLLNVTARTVGRNLSRAEWDQFKLPAKDYQRLFDTLPEPPAPWTARPPLAFPANRPGAATAKRLGKVILKEIGDLTAADPLDPVLKHPSKNYTLELKSGAMYVIDMKKAVQRSRFDSYLRLEGPDGKQVKVDDDSGGDLNARIVYPCKQDGVYKIIATTYNGKPGQFVLTTRDLVPPPIFAPLPLQSGSGSTHGELTADDWEHAPQYFNCPCKVYSVQLEAGKVYQFDLQTTAFVPNLSLGEAENNLVGQASGQNPRIVFICKKSATYRLTVTSANGTHGALTLAVQSQ
jgi:WD40 repeat protein